MTPSTASSSPRVMVCGVSRSSQERLFPIKLVRAAEWSGQVNVMWWPDWMVFGLQGQELSSALPKPMNPEG